MAPKGSEKSNLGSLAMPEEQRSAKAQRSGRGENWLESVLSIGRLCEHLFSRVREEGRVDDLAALSQCSKTCERGKRRERFRNIVVWDTETESGCSRYQVSFAPAHLLAQAETGVVPIGAPLKEVEVDALSRTLSTMPSLVFVAIEAEDENDMFDVFQKLPSGLSGLSVSETGIGFDMCGFEELPLMTLSSLKCLSIGGVRKFRVDAQDIKIDELIESMAGSRLSVLEVSGNALSQMTHMPSNLPHHSRLGENLTVLTIFDCGLGQTQIRLIANSMPRSLDELALVDCGMNTTALRHCRRKTYMHQGEVLDKVVQDAVISSALAAPSQVEPRQVHFGRLSDGVGEVSATQARSTRSLEERPGGKAHVRRPPLAGFFFPQNFNSVKAPMLGL